MNIFIKILLFGYFSFSTYSLSSQTYENRPKEQVYSFLSETMDYPNFDSHTLEIHKKWQSNSQGLSISTLSTKQKGRFINVEGLSYQTDSQLGAYTQPDGVFEFLPGEMISFFIGPYKLGSALAKPIMTPIDFIEGAQSLNHSQVVTMTRFLMSLDTDQNPDNGIQILEEIYHSRALYASQHLPITDLPTNLLNVTAGKTHEQLQLAFMNPTSLSIDYHEPSDNNKYGWKSDKAIKSYLSNFLTDLIQGEYEGNVTSYSGAFVGQWSLTVHPSGQIKGHFEFSPAPHVHHLNYQLTGYFDPNTQSIRIKLTDMVFESTQWDSWDLHFEANGMLSGIWKTGTQFPFHNDFYLSGQSAKPFLACQTKQNLKEKIAVITTWENTHADIDLHIIEPDDVQVNYENLYGYNGFLVHDDDKGGLESYYSYSHCNSLVVGKYKIAVNLFNQIESSTQAIDITTIIHTPGRTKTFKQHLDTGQYANSEEPIVIAIIEVSVQEGKTHFDIQH